MPMQSYYVRSKEKFEDINMLMVVSHLKVFALDEQGVLLSVSSKHAYSEEFPLDNVPEEINSLEEVLIKITPEKFDHLSNLYENDIKKFHYYNPDNEEL